MEFGFYFSHAKAAKCPGDVYSHRLSCLCMGVSWLFLGERCNCVNLPRKFLEGVCSRWRRQTHRQGTPSHGRVNRVLEERHPEVCIRRGNGMDLFSRWWGICGEDKKDIYSQHGIGWTFRLREARGCNYIIELCDFISLFSVTTFPEPFNVLPCLDLLTFFLYYT